MSHNKIHVVIDDSVGKLCFTQWGARLSSEMTHNESNNQSVNWNKVHLEPKLFDMVQNQNIFYAR